MGLQRVVHHKDAIEINVTLHELYCKITLKNDSRGILQIHKLDIVLKEHVQFPLGIDSSMKHAIYKKVKTVLSKIRAKNTWQDTENLVSLIKAVNIDQLTVELPLL